MAGLLETVQYHQQWASLIYLNAMYSLSKVRLFWKSFPLSNLFKRIEVAVPYDNPAHRSMEILECKDVL
jgi:hypothetical protein